MRLEPKTVVVYVEGRSDADGLEILLDELITQKRHRGVSIEFFPAGNKNSLLNAYLDKAVNIVVHRTNSQVVILPDLYPRNQGFEHDNRQELFEGIKSRLKTRLQTKPNPDPRVLKRVHSFCFKHDFESLLLAAPDAMKAHLNTHSLGVTWVKPVEEQNHEDPPKRVVERIFESCGEKYVETEDAFEILAAADYRSLAEACPQSFAPFVDYLESL